MPTWEPPSIYDGKPERGGVAMPRERDKKGDDVGVDNLFLQVKVNISVENVPSGLRKSSGDLRG